jgi:Holliday junction resolvasome RuvABC endonuclease subunit
MNILAIDPASRCGFAHSSGPYGVWNLGSGAIRLQSLDDLITAALAKWPTDVVAYESATFGSRHLHVMRRHNELAGVIELVAIREHVQCWSYPPSQWKAIALTNGRLDKSGVMRALKIIYGIETTDPDIADAAGILKAALKGPPPETKKKQRRLAEKRLKKIPRLFR